MEQEEARRRFKKKLRRAPQVASSSLGSLSESISKPKQAAKRSPRAPKSGPREPQDALHTIVWSKPTIFRHVR